MHGHLNVKFSVLFLFITPIRTELLIFIVGIILRK